MKATWILVAIFLTCSETLSGNLWAGEGHFFVDPATGTDANPGTAEQPLRTLGRAAVLVNERTEPGPVTVCLAPGIYDLHETVLFENDGAYTKEERLTVTAQYLPDDPGWNPSLMPIILSTEAPKKTGQTTRKTETYSLKVKTSHVSICGLRFLGNPSLNDYHAVIERVGPDLEDLVVTQCAFIGDTNGLDVYCPIIGTGSELIVDHCVFVNCHASVVYWDGLANIGSKRNALRYCIIYGARVAGPWTCQTDEDFECHHNVIAGCNFAWMRKPGDRQQYSLEDCVVVGCESFSGCGGPFGPFRSTGEGVTFTKKNVTEEGHVVLMEDRNDPRYLQLETGSLGSNLGAGLSKK